MGIRSLACYGLAICLLGHRVFGGSWLLMVADGGWAELFEYLTIGGQEKWHLYLLKQLDEMRMNE